MKSIQTELPGVIVFEPKVISDSRGYFFESFRQTWLPKHSFVQENQSESQRGTLRGIHYQLKAPQGKLVSVIRGAVLDVAVDLRRGSETFGQHVSRELSAENHHIMWIPEGFGHGFLALTDIVEFQYKCTNYYAPDDQFIVRWDDPDLAVNWGVSNPIVSERDAEGAYFKDAVVFE